MQLGGDSIRRAFADGVWKAYIGHEQLSVDDLVIGSRGIDVHLFPVMHKVLRSYKRVSLAGNGPGDSRLDTVTVDLRDRDVTLEPGGCYLASVCERFDVDAALPWVLTHYDSCFLHWVADITGRSSLGRVFVSVHQTAGFGEYGFKGAFTLEIKNDSPNFIRIEPGARIAQVYFQAVLSPTMYAGAYGGVEHYVGPRLPVLGDERFKPSPAVKRYLANAVSTGG